MMGLVLIFVELMKWLVSVEWCELLEWLDLGLRIQKEGKMERDMD